MNLIQKSNLSLAFNLMVLLLCSATLSKGAEPQRKSDVLPAEGAAAEGGRKALSDAKQLVKANRLADAEAMLSSGNRFTPSSSEWHLETCQKLGELARELAKDGEHDQVRQVAVKALQHLNQVAGSTGNRRTRAKAKAAAAQIEESLLGDPAAAIASYTLAVQLDSSDKGIKEALDRLQAADTELRMRIQGNKGKK